MEYTVSSEVQMTAPQAMGNFFPRQSLRELSWYSDELERMNSHECTNDCIREFVCQYRGRVVQLATKLISSKEAKIT